jgi:MOSC domain-containing protein YiiM
MTCRQSVELCALFTSPGHDFKGHHGGPRAHHPIVDAETIECVAGKGIKGDRYFDSEKHRDGQITFFDWAVLEAIRERFGLPNLDPSAFRRNVVVRGADLNALVGRTFELQGLAFQGTEECTPCYWMDQAVAPGAEDFLRGRGGLRARILSSGALRRGPADLVLCP